MSQSIILFSHGSVLCGAGESLFAMAHELEELAGCKVGVGYLNYNKPSFADAVDAAIGDGVTEITVVPYFLVAGYFVKQKLPPLVQAAKERHPQIIFHISDALRAHALMPEIVLTAAERTQTIDEWRLWWKVAPEFCRNDTACPLYDTALCAVKSVEVENTDSFTSSLPPLRESSDLFNSEKTALLILVHGSPREESNIDMYGVVEEVRATQKYFYVQVGFLECNDPPIRQAIDKCIDAGAERIIAVPYFLHAGRHVADDLPRFLEDASKQHPAVKFLMSEYLGREPLLARVLLDLAEQSQNTTTPL